MRSGLVRCAGCVCTVLSFATALVVLARPTPADGAITRDDVFVIEDVDGKIMEAVGTPNGYLAQIACRMRQVYPGSDRFDAIFVFSGIPLGVANVQQGWPVIQAARGIGRQAANMSAAFCSNNRLRHAVKMGYLSVLPNDPDGPAPSGMPFVKYALSAIELMAHEFGHQWLAALTFDKGDGTGRHCLMRGWSGDDIPPVEGEELCDGWSLYDYNQHWSYLYNSHSVMYGNMIEDLGDGRFRFYYDDPKFSEMDQYAMGLRGPGEVPPQFVVLKDDQSLSPQSPTADEWIMEGASRMDFTVQDVIRAEGERLPAREPCHWKGALVFLWSRTAGGLGPSDGVLDKVAAYGNRWEEWYAWATDGRGSFDMTADNRGYGTETCPDPFKPPIGEDPGGQPDVVEPADPGVADAPGPLDTGMPDPGADGAEGALDAPGTDRGTTGDLAGTDLGPASDASRVCVPGALACSGNDVVECAPDGSRWTPLGSCAQTGMVCTGSGICAKPGGDSGRSGGCAAASHAAPTPAGFIALVLLAFGGIRRIRGSGCGSCR